MITKVEQQESQALVETMTKEHIQEFYVWYSKPIFHRTKPWIGKAEFRKGELKIEKRYEGDSMKEVLEKLHKDTESIFIVEQKPC